MHNNTIVKEGKECTCNPCIQLEIVWFRDCHLLALWSYDVNFESGLTWEHLGALGSVWELGSREPISRVLLSAPKPDQFLWWTLNSFLIPVPRSNWITHVCSTRYVPWHLLSSQSTHTICSDVQPQSHWRPQAHHAIFGGLPGSQYYVHNGRWWSSWIYQCWLGKQLHQPLLNILRKLQKNLFGSIISSPNFKRMSRDRQSYTLTTMLWTFLLGTLSIMPWPNTSTSDTITLGNASLTDQSCSNSSGQMTWQPTFLPSWSSIQNMNIFVSCLG